MAIGTPVLMKELAVDLTGQGSLALPLTVAGASVGDLVVITGAFGGTTEPTSITAADNSGGGNSYQLDVRADKNDSQTPHSYIISSVLVGALTVAHTITVTFAQNVNRPAAGVYKVSGIVSSSWFDQSNSDIGTGTSPSSGNITTTQADEILIGVLCTGLGQTLSYGSGWTRLGNHLTVTGKGVDQGYSIKAATGTYVYDGSIASAEWADCIASYKGSVSEPTAGNLAPVIYGRGAC